MLHAVKKPPTCPGCGAESTWSLDNPWRPFCSERCKQSDLGAWFTEHYRVPGEPAHEMPDLDVDLDRDPAAPPASSDRNPA